MPAPRNRSAFSPAPVAKAPGPSAVSLEAGEQRPKRGLYWVRHPMNWGPAGTPGKRVTQGQIVELLGLPNDAKLVRLGYIEEYHEAIFSGPAMPCRHCGERFVNLNALNHHGYLIHEPQPNVALERLAARSAEIKAGWSRMTEAERSEASHELDVLSEQAGVAEDQKAEQEHAQAMASAPLHMDKTIASQTT